MAELENLGRRAYAQSMAPGGQPAGGGIQYAGKKKSGGLGAIGGLLQKGLQIGAVASGNPWLAGAAGVLPGFLGGEVDANLVGGALSTAFAGPVYSPGEFSHSDKYNDKWSQGPMGV
jgi:hypothetical protein